MAIKKSSAAAPHLMQSWGAAIFTDRQFEYIRGVSQNLYDHTGLRPGLYIDQPTTALFEERDIHEICNRLGHRDAPDVLERIGPCRIGQQRFDLVLHRVDDQPIIEMIPLIEEFADDQFCGTAVDQLHLLIKRSQQSDTNAALRDVLGRFRALSGFDRVAAIRPLAGRFDVVAEVGFFDETMPKDKVAKICASLSSCVEDGRSAFIPDMRAPLAEIHLQGPSNWSQSMSCMTLRAPKQCLLRQLEDSGLAAIIIVPVLVDNVLAACLVGGHTRPQHVPSALPLQLIEIFAQGMTSSFAGASTG